MTISRFTMWSKISLVCILLGTLAIGTAVCASDSISIYLGGELLSFSEVPPEVVDGRTFVPLRFISDKLGFYEVDYNSDLSLVTVSEIYQVYFDLTTGNGEVGYNKLFTHTVGTSTVEMVNGTVIDIEAKSYIKDSRAMVSLRLFSEAMHFGVQWSGEDNAVYLTKPVPVSTTLRIGLADDLNQDDIVLFDEPIVINADAASVILTAAENLRGFSISSVEQVEGDEFLFTQTATLYSIAQLPAGESLNVILNIPDGAPRAKVSYTNDDGRDEAYLISWNGKTGDLMLLATDYTVITSLHIRAEDDPANESVIVNGEPVIIHEEGTMLLFAANETLHNFKISHVTILDEFFGPDTLLPGDAEYQTDELLKGTGIWVQCDISKGIPDLMVSYSVSEDEKEAYLLAWSDRTGQVILMRLDAFNVFMFYED